MTKYEWKSVSYPVFRQKDTDPELWAAMVSSIEYWENRMRDEMNRALYPRAGDRERAVDRLNVLSGAAGS